MLADNESEDGIPEELQPLVVPGEARGLAVGAVRDRLLQQIPLAKAVLDGVLESGKFSSHLGAVKTTACLSQPSVLPRRGAPAARAMPVRCR